MGGGSKNRYTLPGRKEKTVGKCASEREKKRKKKTRRKLPPKPKLRTPHSEKKTRLPRF